MSICYIYDGRDGLDEDSTFSDYEERIAVSNGNVKCCETGVMIPLGFAYAECRGRTSMTEGDWDYFPQALEVWRLLRSWNIRKVACFAFCGVEEEIAWGALGEARLLEVKWRSTVNRIRKRYQSGAMPRLHKSEAESLATGEFVSQLPFKRQANSTPSKEEDL